MGTAKEKRSIGRVVSNYLPAFGTGVQAMVADFLYLCGMEKLEKK